jgi:formylglycine-generating enzyme required for sulfatase activity
MAAELAARRDLRSAEVEAATPGVFLSYAGADRAVAARVVAGLRAAGAHVWWDRDGIGWSDNWIEKLQNTLTECAAYVILVGAGGVRRWVKAELHIATRRHFENDLPVFPILLHGVPPDSLPPFLSIFQAANLPEDLARCDFAELADRLKAVPAAAEDARPAIDDGTCPFPGLEAFREDDARFFFGRQSETLDALRRLGPGLDGIYRRWLQIEGPSGVGKSSLVRAGLVPAIRRGWIEEGDAQIRRWRVAPPLRPGADPIENLADSLSWGLAPEQGRLALAELDRDLRAGDERALRLMLRQHVADGEGLVLVVDQLEELFTLTAKAKDRARFDALLAEALRDLDGPLHLITTVRSDFMVRFAELPELQGLLNNAAGRYLLPPVSEAGLRDVVRTPARLAGLHWSEASLPGDIVAEAIAEPGALPLVGNLLRLLWDERDGNVLSSRVYREFGGLGGALATRADLLLDSLDAEVGNGRDRARKLLLELVEPGLGSQDSRRTITRQMALAAADGGREAEVVLDRLSGLRGATTPRGARAMPRLVMVSDSPDEPADATRAQVDLAHEALLRNDRHGQPYWKTLRDWVDQYRKQLENRRLLEILAEKWQDGGRPQLSNVLARGRQLRDFRQVGTAISDRAADYLRASRRLRGLRATALAVLVALIAAAGYGSWWTIENETNLRVALRVLAVRVGLGSLAAPTMVQLKGDKFLMGSTEEQKWSQHQVTVPVFEIGKYEVTFDDWDLCVAGGGCNGYTPSDQGWGRGRRPVINVSWDDAKAYVDWLSGVTGEPYRLPSEAEWEYAARAGTTTRYWWGDDAPTPDQANFGSNVGKTTEVGSKPYPANPWGMYDMNGNVWEWVEDCWHDSYAEEGRPDDGTAWTTGSTADCSRRVLRGGSWVNDPEALRSAGRNWSLTGIRISLTGFRVARTLSRSESVTP